MFFRKISKPVKSAGAGVAGAKPRAVNTDGYRGPERRRDVRRHAAERRDSLRWEPKKTDRRKSFGRRSHDGSRVDH